MCEDIGIGKENTIRLLLSEERDLIQRYAVENNITEIKALDTLTYAVMKLTRPASYELKNLNIPEFIELKIEDKVLGKIPTGEA